MHFAVALHGFSSDRDNTAGCCSCVLRISNVSYQIHLGHHDIHQHHFNFLVFIIQILIFLLFLP
jgi:hypothetical protein